MRDAAQGRSSYEVLCGSSDLRQKAPVRVDSGVQSLLKIQLRVVHKNRADERPAEPMFELVLTTAGGCASAPGWTSPCVLDALRA
jgi:hypothetical protein